MTNQTAAQLREEARELDARAEESFQRCDTDGFLSQWANGISAQERRMQAEIVENGGRSTFPALFDLDGELVAAKLVDGKYGIVWGILPDDDPHGRFVEWFNPSRARTGAARRRNDERKGYRVGLVKAAARAKVIASGTGLSGAASAYVGVVRCDGGFSRDVEIVDNGTGEDAYADH